VLAEAEAYNCRVLTKKFIGDDMLHALLNTMIPEKAINARDVLVPEYYKKLGLHAPPVPLQ
jgi:hypothetical protein